MRRVSRVRDEQYRLMRGLFHGSGDDEEGDSAARLHALTVDAEFQVLGKALDEAALQALGVQVQAVRRRGARVKMTAMQAGLLRQGDVVVLLGAPEALELAEEMLRR